MKRELEPYQLIERSIIKKYRRELWKPFIAAVKRYELIAPGDRIAVCISGGKDSMLLAKLMQELQRHTVQPFELTFLVMDPGYHPANRRRIEENAARLEIPCGDAEADEGAVRSLAGRGSCVVVGLCADHVLSGQPGLNRIFIHCGMEQRVERLIRERGLSPAEAAREALRQDRERARLYGLHTGAKWGGVGRYDLTVDSGPLGVSGTVELLSQFIALKTMRRRSKEDAHAGTTD